MASATSEDTTRAQLAMLVEKHSGNMSAIAAALAELNDTVSRQAVRQRLKKHGLLARATELGVKSRVPGRRASSKGLDKVYQAERLRVVTALARSTTRAAAARRLKTPLRTLTRRISDYEITEAEVARRRRALGRPPA